MVLKNQNFLEVKHIPQIPISFRLTEELLRKIDAFSRNSLSNRVDKLAYLIRLFAYSGTEVENIPLSFLSKKERPHRTGSSLPEDAVHFINDFADKHKLPKADAFDIVILEALTLSRHYELNLALVKKDNQP